MKYLLHIDTSTDTGTVALGQDGVLKTYRTNQETRNHASALNIMIDDALAEAGIQLQQVDAITVCAGPGSYTGLRIGLATAKGICYALNKPLLLNNRLTLLCYQAHLLHKGYEQYITLIVARTGEYFITIHNHDFTLFLPPQHVGEEQLANLVIKNKSACIITDAPAEIVNRLDLSNIHLIQDTQLMLDAWCRYALSEYDCNNIVNLQSATPFYLKDVYTHK